MNNDLICNKIGKEQPEVKSHVAPGCSLNCKVLFYRPACADRDPVPGIYGADSHDDLCNIIC